VLRPRVSTDRRTVRQSGGARLWVKALAKNAFEPLLAAGALAVVVACSRWGAQPPAEQPARTGQATASGAYPTAATARQDLDAGLRGQAQSTAAGDAAIERESQVGVLSRWHQAFEQLAAGRREGSLRVLWFGDSHIAADYFPNAVRKRLAARTSIGGPGYISLGVPGYRHGLAKVWSEGNLELSPHPPARRSREDDGVFGIGGTRVTLRDPTAYLTAKANLTTPVPMKFELTYRLPADSDALRVIASGQRFELTSTTSLPLSSGLRQQRFEARSDTTIEIRALRGRPQVFGIVMETEQPGLVIDTLGINGARFGTLLAWDEQALAPLVEQRQPRLVIIAYGTNEVFDPEPVARHAKRLDEVVQRLRRCAVDADCVVVGPTDAGKGGEATRSRAAAVDAAERATAERLGCAYFSPFELMVSEGGYEAWARQEPSLALSDGIHLSARGYARLGEALSGLLEAGP
jgi:lysophospholipase L1-like esterase